MSILTETKSTFDPTKQLKESSNCTLLSQYYILFPLLQIFLFIFFDSIDVFLFFFYFFLHTYV